MLDFTKLTDEQIKHFLKFISPDLIENGEIERYILSGKCKKIKIEYYDKIIIEESKVTFHPEVGASMVILTLDDIKNCVNLYNVMINNF